MTTLIDLELEHLNAKLETLRQSIMDMEKELAYQRGKYDGTQLLINSLLIDQAEAEQADQSPEK